MKNTTLLFLIKESEGKITDVCLAMKKRGFGAGRWNGAGGKVKEGESIEEAVLRETEEEICVKAKNIRKVAEFDFSFPHNPDWNQRVHFYFTTDWEGEISESEEMKPQWFSVKDIPFSSMWPDDIFWMPRVLSGELVKGFFVFGENDAIQSQKIETVKSL